MEKMWGFFEKPPHTPKNFKKFLLRSRIVRANSTDSTQRACWNSATPNTNVFVLKRTKTALCYVVRSRFDNNVSIVLVANHRFSSRLLKWRENRYVLCNFDYTTQFARNFVAKLFKKFLVLFLKRT